MMEKLLDFTLTRRQWLHWSAVGSAAVVAGCFAPAASGPVPEHTAPAPPVVPPALQPAPASEMALAAMIGQMFMVGFRGLIIEEDHPIVSDVVERNLGSVVLFDYDVPNGEFVRNIESPAQLRSLTDALQAAAARAAGPQPLLIAADQEGGVVARLNERYGFPATVSHAALGAADNLEETYAQASRMAATLAAAGVNLNLAPVVDVNVNPDNPVIAAYERSFSADPQRVAQHAAAFIEGHHAHDVLCTLKHFPGHGSSREDSHRGFVDVTQTWSPLELEPYAALIEAGLADSVMTAHVFNAAWHATDPATLAPAAIDGLLRGQLGYDGVVISDDMQMGAIREYYSFEESIQKAIAAGVDIIAIANNSIYDEQAVAKGIAVVQKLVEAGVVSGARIAQSYARIARLKARL